MIGCLPKHIADLFLEKLKSGEIDPAKLTDMSSKERNTFFASFMGKENAASVNADFESKLLLKNRQLGIINWAKSVSGLKEATKRDLISKANRMTEILQPEEMDDFLADLAARRLGVGVTVEEAGKIADLAKTASDRKGLIKEDSPIRSATRMEYGTAVVAFKDYVGSLKAEAKKLTPKEFLLNPAAWLEQIGGVTKSIAASLDNSFFGRQGFITLVTNPDIWVNNFKKSWGDMRKELTGVDAMTPIKADVFSRPNALNGNYKAMKLDIGIESEEAFPSSLPEKVPLLGKLFKASESAYNGAALRFRADLADRLIEKAEAMDVNVKDKDTGLGRLINSMTGRGSIQLTPGQSKLINVGLFSIKYLKSNLDVLTAHVFDKKVGAFARKEAANNLLKTIRAMAIMLMIAKFLDDESVELDPRSFDFGKIKVGKNHEIKINISLGMGSIVTLASRITPTLHKGEWGFWYKTSKGRFIKTGTGRYGEIEPSELVFDFIKGKAAPIARTLLTVWEGKNFAGVEPKLGDEALTLITPIPVENLFELAKTSASSNVLLYAILTALDMVGVNTSVKRNKRSGGSRL